MLKSKLIILVITITILSFCGYSCSKEEEVRMPQDILGIWAPSNNLYLDFTDDYRVRVLQLEQQEGEIIGIWREDAYLYEPGYNLVIYLNGLKADVYEIVRMTSTELTWCWVKEVTEDDAGGFDDLGHVMGDIIKEAQEGFHLDSSLYQTFQKIPESEYHKIIDSLGIFYPWE